MPQDTHTKVKVGCGPVCIRALPAFLLFFGYRPTRAGRHAPSGKGGKRMILLAAGSLLTAFLPSA